MDKPYLNTTSRLLPTGVPIDTRPTSNDPVFYVGNLLTNYGVPNAMKTAYVLKDYLTTNSLFSYIDLIKLTTEFGLAYTTAALAVSLGKEATKELAAMTLIYNVLNLDSIDAALPALAKVPVYPEDANRALQEVFAWFDYPFLSPREVLSNPSALPNWIVQVEPVYAELFGSLTIDPEVFFKLLLNRIGFGMTNELKQWIKGAYLA